MKIFYYLTFLFFSGHSSHTYAVLELLDLPDTPKIIFNGNEKSLISLVISALQNNKDPFAHTKILIFSRKQQKCIEAGLASNVSDELFVKIAKNNCKYIPTYEKKIVDGAEITIGAIMIED